MSRLLPRVLLVLGSMLGVLFHPLPVHGDDWADARKAFRRASKEADWRARRDAFLEVLDFEGPNAVAEIVRAMGKEKHPAVRQAGAEALAGFVSKDAAASLVQALARAKGELKLYLLYAMARRTDAAGADLLVEIARGKDERAAAQALLALGQRRDVSRLDVLAALLGHEHPRVRAAAARGIRLAVGPPPAPPTAGQEPQPWLPEGVQTDPLIPKLVDALENAEGPERHDVIRALGRLTKQDLGAEARAWRQLAEGTSPDEIEPGSRTTPHVFGFAVHGSRIVLLIDSSSGSRRAQPFEDKERLAEIRAVPGGEPIPPGRLHTVHQLERAHATRLIQDLPERGTKLDVLSVSQTTTRAFGKLLEVNASLKKRATSFIEKLEIRDGPDHYASLVEALDAGGSKDSVAWNSGPDSIVMMTCSIPWAPGDKSAVVDQEELSRIVGLHARFRMIPIHTIGIGHQPREMLRRLADLSGGTYLDLER